MLDAVHHDNVPQDRRQVTRLVPRALTAWANDPGRETAEPMESITDAEIQRLERLVETERASAAHHTRRERLLLEGIDRAILAVRNERERSTRARMILTMVWQSRRLLTGDFWSVTDRELDAMACRMVEMYFGGPFGPNNHPNRRATDTPEDTEH